MNVLEKILEEMKKIKEGNRREKLYAKYPAESQDEEKLNIYSQGYEDGTDNFYNAIVSFIHTKIKKQEEFEFDFTGVKTFDCQCGRHYVNTAHDDWIPCSKRLPEKNVEELYDMQLVTLKDGEVCLGVYRNEDDEWWTRKQEGERVYTNTHEVIAWQPLPEPYRAADKPDWKENMLNTFLAGH